MKITEEIREMADSDTSLIEITDLGEKETSSQQQKENR